MSKEKITEELRILEVEVDDAKSDLETINGKLERAYQYEDDLIQRHEFAKQNTKQLRQDYFQKSSEITQLFNEMKKQLDVWTGNFFK